MKNNETKLTKKDIRAASWRYIFFHHSAQNYERMMGLAFGHVVAKPLRIIYEDDEEYRQSLVRHVQYFNSNPNLGALVPGIVLALEEGRSVGKDISVDLIINTKTAIMGPLAGIGDPLIGSVYNSIIASIAIGLAMDTGTLMGPLFYLIFSTGVLVMIKHICFFQGYKLGTKAIQYLTGAWTTIITTALSIVGVITIGGITSTTVKVPVSLQFVNGESTLVVQEILDKIMPGLLPLGVTILIWYLYTKKGWSTIKALLLIILISFVSVLLGIF